MSTSEKRQRSQLLRVRLNAAELAKAQADAQARGQSLGGYVREKLLGAPTPGTRRQPAPNAETLARLLGQMGKVGSNLNQLARLANQRNLVPPATLDACMAEVQQVAADISQALHGGH